MRRLGTRSSIHVLILALLLPLAGLAGCDSITGSSSGDGIEGTWVLVDGDYTTYVRITSNTVAVYDGYMDSCFERISFNIVSHDGDVYTLGYQLSDQTMTVTIVRNGDNLVVTFADGSETYQSSNQNVDQLELCTADTGGGADPSIDCSSLPAISVGQTINGELNTSDDINSGRYFDLYGLTLGSPTQVQIDAVSDPVDMYLYLYESDGTFLGEDDDGGTGYNSKMTPTLQAGCYRIEVTSFSDGETGVYTLSVSAP